VKISVIFSLIVHLCCLGLALWMGSQSPRPPTKPTFLVQVEEPIGSGTGLHGRKKHSHKASSPPPTRRLELGLTAKSSDESNSRQASPANISEGGVFGGSLDGYDGYDVANGIGIEREGELYPFFDALWRKVNATTAYPDEFIQQRVKGKVTAQIVVDHRGVFTGEVKAVHGSEPMLNTFVLATLIHALREPLLRNTWMDLNEPGASDRMLLVFQFDFELFGPGGAPKKAEFAHFKNVLSFRKDSYVEPALNQAINRIFTRYLPPIIPIPGGFFIDFIRAYKFFENMASPTPDPDELRRSRLELKKEQWESVIQRRAEG